MHLNIYELECFKYDNLSQIVLHNELFIGSANSWVLGFKDFSGFYRIFKQRIFFLKIKADYI